MKVAIKGPRLWSKRVARYAQNLYVGCTFQPAWAYSYEHIRANYDLLLHYVDYHKYFSSSLIPIIDYMGRNKVVKLDYTWRHVLYSNKIKQLEPYREMSLYVWLHPTTYDTHIDVIPSDHIHPKEGKEGYELYCLMVGQAQEVKKEENHISRLFLNNKLKHKKLLFQQLIEQLI